MTGLAPLQRHYSAGPRHAYAYTYADPREVGPRPPMQLEFWVPKGRKGGQWVMAHAFDGMRHPWRKVFAGHSHADKLSHSIAMRPAGYARDVDTQVKQYIAWAIARGLSRIHVFEGCKVAAKWVPAALECVEVDPADFIGPAPEPETDTRTIGPNDGDEGAFAGAADRALAACEDAQ